MPKRNLFKWVGIQAKLDQTIQIQKSLKETGEAILQKAEHNTEYQQLKDQCASAQNKIDDAVRIQRQLLALGDEISSKSDQALSGQRELKKKAEQAAVLQQDLVKKADQALVVQQELVKKTEQALTCQKKLNESNGIAQNKFEQILVNQKHCVNETEFARMSMTLFSSLE